MLDGHTVGTVRNGRDFAVDVPPGAHQVKARIDWSGSSLVDFVVEPGAEVHLDLRPAGTILGIYWRVFTATKWLALRPLDGPLSLDDAN